MPENWSQKRTRATTISCLHNATVASEAVPQPGPGFWFLVCYAATQLTIQVQQERIQMVRSNKVARKEAPD